MALLWTALCFAGCDEEGPAPASDPAGPSAAATAPQVQPEEQPELERDLEPWSEPWLLAEGERYLQDPEHRRRSMARSLRNHDNLYSRTRIASYGRGDRGWDRLPVWNPRSRSLTPADREILEGGSSPQLGDAGRLWDGERPRDLAGWVALGREVFHRYPLRSDAHVRFGLTDRERAEELGIEAAPDGTVPGVVLFRDLDGSERVGITCALCHTERVDDRLVEGRARRRLDYGALQLAHAEARGRELDPEMARRMASWGPGRADITEDDSEDPVAIPDLWGLEHQSALTQAGTIKHIGPVAVALRQETQLIYSNHHRSRPPRELVWALAMYLYSLEPAPRQPPTFTAAHRRGRALFEAHCSDCHSNDAGGGQTVRAAEVGTHPGLANGVARGTGRYRPASLIRVADAGPYFHHGAVGELEEVLSPERLEDGYEGPRGPGAVPGHEYGLELSTRERQDIVAFLRTL